MNNSWNEYSNRFIFAPLKPKETVSEAAVKNKKQKMILRLRGK